MSNNRISSKYIPKEFKEHIFIKSGLYTIRNDRNSIFITFGRFSSINVACAATKLLIKYDWNIRKIGNDLVSEYQKNFYVFKEINNNLILNSKFKSYDDAVEYLEINHKCNDYHNDIFKNKSKKKYSNRYDSSKIDSSNHLANKHIFKQKDKFIVKKFNSKDSFIFGKFDSLNVARAARKILLDSNWELDNEYEISFYDNSYWVFEIYKNKLLFKGKSESYEESFDIINPPKVEINKKYPHPISENKKLDMKRKNINKEPKLNLKVKKNGEVTKIWKSTSKKIEKKDIIQRIFVQNCSKTGNKFFYILDFNYFMDTIKYVITRVDFKLQKRQVIDAKNFPEFKLIIKIL